ncbi:MAG TPA: hypothetical protein VFS32_08765 [Candidatus Limnocylindrales bacterium]|nr:hypothetical protein [Candidatus Limnocylindrales bacterium]
MPDPLAGVRMIVVDATNLAHALARRSGPGAVPRAAVLGRIRGAIPATTAIELVFDGPPEPGASVRAASGVTVRYGGRRPADALILERVLVEAEGFGGARTARTAETARTAAGATTSPLLVVTDDAELARAARDRGARTARTAWLIARLERGRLVAPATGNPRPPKAASGSPDAATAAGPDRPGWRPGRGATTKRGNARRPRKQSRRPQP